MGCGLLRFRDYCALGQFVGGLQGWFGWGDVGKVGCLPLGILLVLVL